MGLKPLCPELQIAWSKKHCEKEPYLTASVLQKLKQLPSNPEFNYYRNLRNYRNLTITPNHQATPAIMKSKQLKGPLKDRHIKIKIDKVEAL